MNTHSELLDLAIASLTASSISLDVHDAEIDLPRRP
jgi:hypothetical protein